VSAGATIDDATKPWDHAETINLLADLDRFIEAKLPAPYPAVASAISECRQVVQGHADRKDLGGLKDACRWLKNVVVENAVPKNEEMVSKNAQFPGAYPDPADPRPIIVRDADSRSVELAATSPLPPGTVAWCHYGDKYWTLVPVENTGGGERK